MRQPKATIRKCNIAMDDCLHCAGITAHVVGPRGKVCLQCIADEAKCGCSLRAYNRWRDAPATASR